MPTTLLKSTVSDPAAFDSHNDDVAERESYENHERDFQASKMTPVHADEEAYDDMQYIHEAATDDVLRGKSHNDEHDEHVDVNLNDDNENENENEASVNSTVSSSKRSMTPLSKGAILAILTIYMAEGFVYSFIFPFMGFMILDFGLVKDSKDAGYYAGMLAGSYAIAQFFSGFIYGYLSDKASKKLIILVSAVGCCISIVGFGLCRRFVSALCVRAIGGALNGSMVTTKAYISEVTDSTNQAIAFSLITVGWGVGAMVGPVAGGLLSSPVSKYPTVFGSMKLFETFPYLLPCLTAAMILVIDFVLILLFMKDVKKKDNAPSTDIELTSMNRSSSTRAMLSEDNEPNTELELEPTVPKQSVGSKFMSLIKAEVLGSMAVMKNKEVAVCIVLSFLCSMIEIFQDELLPLWAMVKKEEGGLSFSTNEIGVAQSIFGGLYLVMPLIYPPLSKWLGHLWCAKIGFIGIIVLFFTPQMALLPPNGWIWTGFVFYGTIRALTGTLTFTATFIFVSNSVETEASGRVQGVATSASSISKAVAPLIAGPVLAMSINMGHSMPWINIPFACFTLMTIVSLALTFLLDKSIEVPKNEHKTIE